MRTEKEIKESVKLLQALDKNSSLGEKEKHGLDVLLWVLGKDFK